MSHFAVHIGTSNDALSDEDNGAAEVARILRELAAEIEEDWGARGLYRLRDVNGNRVGYATFSEADEPNQG
jgi:hypothetical protein